MAANALGQRIGAVEVRAPRLLQGISPRSLAARLKGRKFSAARRHGKYLFAGVQGGGWLVLHFGMTGWLYYLRAGVAAPRHVRLLIRFARDASLAYDNLRMFGLIAWANDVEEFIHARRLGPDALQIPGKRFQEMLAGRRGGLKAMLMDQSLLAGVGNIYADEILFQARLHPSARIERLNGQQLSRLYRELRRVLRKAVDARAHAERMPASFLLRSRRQGGRCPRCRRKLKRATIAGRTTYYCEKDQAKGLAKLSS